MAISYGVINVTSGKFMYLHSVWKNMDLKAFSKTTARSRFWMNPISQKNMFKKNKSENVCMNN